MKTMIFALIAFATSFTLFAAPAPAATTSKSGASQACVQSRTFIQNGSTATVPSAIGLGPNLTLSKQAWAIWGVDVPVCDFGGPTMIKCSLVVDIEPNSQVVIGPDVYDAYSTNPTKAQIYKFGTLRRFLIDCGSAAATMEVINASLGQFLQIQVPTPTVQKIDYQGTPSGLESYEQEI